MAQMAKIEDKTQIMCAPPKVYNFFKNDLTELTKIVPQLFQSVKVIDGNKGQAGGVIQYELLILGKAMTAKVKTEAINDEEKSISFVILEGDIMELYKSFKAKVTVGDGTAMWCLEFEKANDSAPNPDQYATLAVEITKGLDLYLLNSI
ncbi:hypothetical protein DH2020_012475 [Rehmannia glutinosa]|uniref:Bet v I/Major latex protein domain-containing protein n=1 Tax=Rehmannia glutinosa TaxID=99300 RepID=A0ABR0X1Z0_REHGL